MKHFVPIMAIAITALFSAPASATNYVNNGTFAAYNLSNGDTLRIAQGTFNGVIAQLPAGAVIIVAPNATFSPTTLNIWAPAGKIINNGKFQFSSLGLGANFMLDNYGTTTVQGDMSFYSGAAKKLTNYAGAVMTITGSLTLNENTTILNQGIINITRDLELYAGSATFTNVNVVNVGRNLNTQGKMSNENIMNVQGDLNFWGGQLNNTGQLSPDGTFSISAGTTYVNQCKMITKGGINNYGTFYNYGLVWAGTTNTSDDFFTNSGTFINGTAGRLRTVNLTNYGNIRGGGYLYATGQTTLGSGATIGISGSTTDTIRFYDVTRSNASRMFDNQWGTIMPNVKFQSFMQPDTVMLFTTCSNQFRAGYALPVKWNYFHVKTVQELPLLTWSAEYEAGMQFEIERSYDNSNYQSIARLSANSAGSYSYTDAQANMSNEYISYRIKGISTNGSVKYSEVRLIRNNVATAAAIAVNVFPNPTHDVAFVSYAAQKNEAVTVSIRSAHGQQLVSRSFTASQGANKFAIHEVKTLTPGMYYVQVVNENGVAGTQKLIVK